MNGPVPTQPEMPDEDVQQEDNTPAAGDDKQGRPKEIGGRKGPDPTRYGDWEKAGRCIDF